jgi:hypothetical protein
MILQGKGWVSSLVFFERGEKKKEHSLLVIVLNE